MDRITLKNYRCFREEQSARLAPLTLLVGDNSTGKTSFLAMIRVLWDLANGFGIPDFKEDPYDLGSFEEIVHHRGSRSGRKGTFEAGVRRKWGARGLGINIGSARLHETVKGERDEGSEYQLDFTFGKSGATPVPIRTRIDIGGIWVEGQFKSDDVFEIKARTNKGIWEMQVSNDDSYISFDSGVNQLPFHTMAHRTLAHAYRRSPRSIYGSPEISMDDFRLIESVLDSINWVFGSAPFASAPVRSKPRRTYDPSRPTRDPEGENTPMYLASVFVEDRKKWDSLKRRLEEFGQDAGLFDEISIKQLGRNSGDPFQVQVRKFGGRLKGPSRNLIDVGYGVSQVLPVITELLRADPPPMFLLQQPEVHLHPRAQSALGSLFCKEAANGKQLIVETHSDHLMDRIRMDVRDGVSDLKSEDVSILFFERNELDVRIHSLGIDEQGNITGAPQGYRKFFMEEVRRSLWA